MNMNNIDAGAKRLVEEYLRVNQNESIYIYVDYKLHEKSVEVAYKTKNYISKTNRCDIGFEEHINPAQIPDNYDAYIFAGGVRSHGKQEAIALKKSGKKVIRIFDFGLDLFNTCLVPSQQQIININQALLNKLKNTKKITIKGDTGTHLVVEIDPHYLWTDSHGAAHENFPGVLPPGEVNTYPLRVDGRLVAGGALNSNLGLPCSPILKERDLWFEIKDSKIVDWDCSSPALKLALQALFSIENATRVGELGLGTNVGVKNFVPYVSHINERHPGPHLGFGTPTQASSKVNWSCPSHVDVMIPKCRVYFDDAMVYDGNAYCLAIEKNPTALTQEVFYVDAV